MVVAGRGGSWFWVVALVTWWGCGGGIEVDEWWRGGGRRRWSMWRSGGQSGLVLWRMMVVEALGFGSNRGGAGGGQLRRRGLEGAVVVEALGALGAVGVGGGGSWGLWWMWWWLCGQALVVELVELSPLVVSVGGR